MNVGELMEIFTNGLFPATRHRVVVPEKEVIRKQPRQSMVFFIIPGLTTQEIHHRDSLAKTFLLIH